MTEVHISAVRAQLGAPTPITALADTDVPAEVRDALAADFTHFRLADEPIRETAAKAAGQTLQAASAEPTLLIYVSENDTDPVESLPKLAERLDLPDAELIAVAGHECGNLGPALSIIRNAIQAGQASTVLLVLADHARADRRVMDNGLSVFSDGAAACLVTADPPAGPHLRLLDAVTVRTATDDHSLLTTARAAGLAVAAIEQRTGIPREQVGTLAFSNYRWTSQQFLAAAVRLPADRLLRSPTADVAHCFSADLLVNLDGALRNGVLSPGERVLACGMGPWSWSVMAFECAG